MYLKEKYISPIIDVRKVTIFPVMDNSTVNSEVSDSETGNTDDELAAKSSSGGFETNSFSTEW